jgi:hypothetical protein
MSTSLTPLHSASLPDGNFLGKFCHVPHVDIGFRASDSHDLILAQKSYVIDSSPVLGELLMAETCHGAGSEGESHPKSHPHKLPYQMEIMND